MKIIIFFIIVLMMIGFDIFRNSPYQLMKAELGVTLPYFSSEKIAHFSSGGFGDAENISLFRVADGAVDVCRDKGVLEIIDYDYDSVLFLKIVHTAPKSLGMGVKEGRRIYLKKNRESFQVICDGNYVLWTHTVN